MEESTLYLTAQLLNVTHILMWAADVVIGKVIAWMIVIGHKIANVKLAPTTGGK